MREEWRKKIYDVLRGPIHPMDGETFTELDELATEEVNQLEPIINEILLQFRAEMKNLMACGHMGIHLEQEGNGLVCRMCEMEFLFTKATGIIVPRVN